MKLKKILRNFLPIVCLSTTTILIPIISTSCSSYVGNTSTGDSNIIYINSQNANNLNKNLNSLLSSLTTEVNLDNNLFTQTLNLVPPFENKIKNTNITLMSGANNKVANVTITLVDDCVIKFEKDVTITNFKLSNNTLTSIQSYQTGIINE